MKTDLEWLDEMGLCHKCRKAKPAPGRKHCFDCLDKAKIRAAKDYSLEKVRKYYPYYRALYAERKAAGACTRCGKQATHGLYCYEHFVKNKRYCKKQNEANKLRKYKAGLSSEYRKEHDLCYWCGAPALSGKRYCEMHRQKFVAAGKKSAAARKMKDEI